MGETKCSIVHERTNLPLQSFPTLTPTVYEGNPDFKEPD